MITCNICGKSDYFLYVDLGKQKVYTCKKCKNAFTYPTPEAIEYEEEDFHGQFSYENVDDLPIQWKTGIVQQGELIKKSVRPGANILEIGCGQGLLLNYLKLNNFKVYGIEPSKSAASIASKRGINILNGYFPQASFSNVDFDLIIMSHVLEHIENPLVYLKMLSKEFSGKYLLLIQTNYKGLVPTKLKSTWYAWVPDQHFSHFTEDGLKHICKITGLRFIKAEYSSLEHNGYWLSKLAGFLPKKGDQFHALIQL